MLRLIGSVLIIGATSGAGILYGMELQCYLERLLYLRHIVYMLKGELEYSRAPLGELCGRVSDRVKDPYRTWLRAVQRQTENRESDAFMKIWMRTIDRYLKELHLKTAHSMQLKELGACLGQMDQETESQNLKLYLDRMELEIERVREGMASRKRIGNCLGIMSGVFLVVVLI